MPPKALPVASSRARARRLDPAPLAPVSSSEPESLSEQLEKLFAQFGPGAEGYKVRVERKNLRGQGEYLGTIDFTLDLEDDVKAKWGGGDYAGRVVDPNSAYVRRINFLIAGPPRPVLLVDDGAAPVAPRAAESATDRVLQSIAETQRHIVDTLKEMQRGPQTNPIDQITAVARALKDVAAAPAAGTTPLDALALVDRVLSLREKIVGDSNGGGSTSELGEVVKFGVAPLVQMGRDYITYKREEARRGAIPVTTGGAAGAASVESPVVTDPVAVIASRIPPMARAFLLKKAAANANPEMYAEVALDQLSGEDQDSLQTLLAESPDFAERFLAAIPAFAVHRLWFLNWVDAMRGLLSQTDGDGSEGGNGETSAPRVAPSNISEIGAGAQVPA